MEFELVLISDVLDIRDGTHDSPKYQEKGYPLITSKNLKEGKICFEDVSYISEDDYNQINKRSKVDLGDILYSMIGSIGNYALVDEAPLYAIKNVALFKFNNENLNNKYFYFLLNSPHISGQIKSQQKGGTQKFVTLKILRNLKIPLPTLETQKKIAAILDEADKLRQLNKQLITKYDALTQSLFLNMFGDPYKNPKNWNLLPLNKIIIQGPTNGLYKPSKDYGTGTPIIRIDAFYNGIVDIIKLKRVRITKEDLKRYKINSGDFVINRVNSPSHLGKCGLVPFLSENVVYESNMMRITFDDKLVDNQYMLNILSSKFVKNQILNSSKDAVNQSSINQKDVNSFIIPVPPISLQNQFSERIQEIENQKVQAQKALQKSEDLFNSLLQKAFKGELVK